VIWRIALRDLLRAAVLTALFSGLFILGDLLLYGRVSW
jgi:hypothetical protein